MRNLFSTLSRGAFAILLFADTTATNAQETEDRAVVVSGYKIRSSISRETLATAALLSKRVTRWRIGTSFRSIPQFQLNTVSASAMDCQIRENSLS